MIFYIAIAQFFSATVFQPLVTKLDQVEISSDSLT